MLPITVRVPGDSSKQVTTEALVDTGADLTCLPAALIDAVGGECAGSYSILGIGRVPIGSAYSYFLEFEIEAERKTVEIVALGDEPILGRNLINDFTLELDGPARELRITV